MRFALEVWSNDWNQIQRTCHTAERLGYTAFYYGESPTGLNLDCWSVLAALARSTRTIRLGPVIANILPQYRALVLLARQAATVSLLSDGRLDFRSGAGASKRHADPWWAPVGVEYPEYSQRLELLERSVPLLRSLWTGQSVSLDDDPGAREASLGFDIPEIPITVAAVGPAGIECAARHADVWEASYRTPAEFTELAVLFEAAASSTTRRISRSLEVDVFVGRSAADAEAVLARVKAERGPARSQCVIERAICGTPADAIRHVSRLRAAGVEQLVVAFQDPHDPSALEAFAEAMESFKGSPPD